MVLSMRFGLILVLLGMCWSGLNTSTVSANGYTTEILREIKDSYEIKVATSPPTSRIGNIHFEIALNHVNNDSVGSWGWDPRIDKLVIYSVNPNGGSSNPVLGVAGGSLSQGHYDFNVPVDIPGEWQFRVSIHKHDGDTIELIFNRDVKEIIINWDLIMSVVVVLLLLTPLGMLLLRNINYRRGTQVN